MFFKSFFSEVNVGENVLVLDSSNRLVFEPIFDFIHAEKTGIYTFLRLTALNIKENKTYNIEISPEHLIFPFGNKPAVHASTVQIGDLLKVVDGANIFPGLVIIIEEIQSQGYLAPLTRSGTIVIDGIVASNYAVAHSHRMAHLFMQPYRWWRYFVGHQQQNQTEINLYAFYLYEFAKITGVINIF
jgi:Hint module